MFVQFFSLISWLLIRFYTHRKLLANTWQFKESLFNKNFHWGKSVFWPVAVDRETGGRRSRADPRGQGQVADTEHSSSGVSLLLSRESGRKQKRQGRHWSTQRRGRERGLINARQGYSEKQPGLEQPWASGCSTAEGMAVKDGTQEQYLREVGTWDAAFHEGPAVRGLGRRQWLSDYTFIILLF